MAFTFRIYCAQSTDHVRPDDLVAALRGSDLPALADAAGARPGVAEYLAETLAAEDLPDGAPGRCRLVFGGNVRRLFEVQRWRVSTQWDEQATLDDLRDRGHPSAGRIAAAVTSAVDVVEIFVEETPESEVACFAAAVLADVLVQWFGGVYRDDLDGWWEPHPDGVGCRVVRPDRRAGPAQPAGVARIEYARPGLEPPKPVDPWADDPWSVDATAARGAERRRRNFERWGPSPVVPTDCPACRQPIESKCRLRRAPSLAARAVQSAGFAVGVLILVGGGLALFEMSGGADAPYKGRRGVAAGVIAMAAAVFCSYWALRWAESFRKVVRCRCGRCGWRRSITVW